MHSVRGLSKPLADRGSASLEINVRILSILTLLEYFPSAHDISPLGSKAVYADLCRFDNDNHLLEAAVCIRLLMAASM